jgi:hypothetical protein
MVFLPQGFDIKYDKGKRLVTSIDPVWPRFKLLTI